jgi:hypothetical protein
LTQFSGCVDTNATNFFGVIGAIKPFGKPRRKGGTL